MEPRITFSRLRKIKQNTWLLEVNGNDVTLTTTELRNYRLLASKVAEKLNIFLDPERKYDDWALELATLVQAMNSHDPTQL